MGDYVDSMCNSLQKFGDQGKEVMLKEMSSMVDKNCFSLIHKEELTELERERALESLISLTEKKDGTIKA